MSFALRIALASLVLPILAACATYDRNSRLGTGNDTCLDLDSDCRTSHECCSDFCANGTCVKRDR